MIGGRRGFTLIEMLVLIIIIAVVSSVAVPAYGRFHARARFDQAVGRIVYVLAWAKDSAIEHGADSVVRFDFQTDTFTGIVELPAQATDVPVEVQDAAERGRTTPEPKFVKLTDNARVIEIVPFDPRGTRVEGRRGTRESEIRFREDGTTEGALIRVVGPVGHAVEIEVAPATGNIRVRADEKMF